MQKQSLILKGALSYKIKSIFQEHSQRILFIHKDLLELLNFAYDFKLNNLIPNDKIVLFENDTEAIDDFKANTLLFILNPVTSAIKTLNSIILRNETRAINKRYIVYFVPKLDNFCQDQLQRASLTSKIQIHHLNFGLISFNPGLISLQLNPKTHPVEVVNLSVESLMKLSKLSGKFTRIIGKGQKSKAILQAYEKLMEQDDSIQESQGNNLLIVMDRKIDMVSTLLSGHSYEALLDHFFGISHNKIMVPSSLLGGPGQHLQEYLLHNERDPVYEEIAYLSIEQARDYIQKKSSQIKSKLQFKRYNVKTEGDTAEVNKIRSQFQQIQNHTQLILEIMTRMNQLHFYNLINLQTKLINEEKADLEQLHYLSLEYGVEDILRLIGLYSQVYLNAHFYTRFEKEILQIVTNNYSPIHIHSLYLLQKAGILKNNKMRNKWQQIKLQYSLIPDQPSSYTGIHITYSCLSVRFIELILKQKLTPQLSVLLGKQNYSKGMQKWKEAKEVYVFYVGGITYGEISCLRVLEKQMGVRIHILTTNVWGGGKMISKIIEDSDL